jgi:uncharacterized protein (TIGR02246 family)
VLVDEPHVRVTEWRFAPGAETGWHRHGADYVVVPLLDGDLLLEEPGGGSRTASLRRHGPYARREGVEHNVVNANAYDYAFIEIEHIREGEDDAVRAMLDRFVAAWNAHDVEGVMACFSDDCVVWSALGPNPEGEVFQGLTEVAAATRAFFEAFPDAAWTDSRVTALGTRALWEWTFVGTAASSPPTRVLGLDVLELDGDRIRRKTSFLCATPGSSRSRR